MLVFHARSITAQQEPVDELSPWGRSHPFGTHVKAGALRADRTPMPRLTYAARSGAGSTATLRFKRGMRSWRTVVVKRTRWAFILVGVIPIAIEIGRANHHALGWALG